MMTRLGVVTAAFLLALGLAQPASAKAPAKVGMVSFVASALSSNGKQASMTITWKKVSGATKYQVFRSTSYGMGNAKSIKTSKTTYNATGLKPGTDYFFQVRALKGSSAGARSSRVGHTTIRAQGKASGPTYKVLTYNLCSHVASCLKKFAWDTPDSPRKGAAYRVIERERPDVLAAQESDGLYNAAVAPEGLQLAIKKSGKSLYFKSSRFDVAVEGGKARVGWVDMTPDTEDEFGNPVRVEHGGGKRYAVWAELIDKATSQRVIFVDVHTVTTADTKKEDELRARQRKDEIVTLLKALKNDINPRLEPGADPVAEPGRTPLPVVFAGDFNSHKNRANDYMAGPLKTNGFYDAYDLARKLTRQHYNSYNGWSVAPKTSVKWGDHVDHVWVDPTSTRVLGWRNAAQFDGSRYATPIPSDHNPILVAVQIN